jgi:uncharacterized protein YkuJ
MNDAARKARQREHERNGTRVYLVEVADESALVTFLVSWTALRSSKRAVERAIAGIR